MSVKNRGRDPYQRRQRRFMREFVSEARKLFNGHVAVATRRNAVDVGQLTPVGDVQLRILDSDVDGDYITSDMVGLFWFSPGYSAVGGPDILRP